MSLYRFIASNFELPEIDHQTIRVITVQEAMDLGIKGHECLPFEEMDPEDTVLIADTEEDLNGLVIHEDQPFEEVRFYTKLLYVYSLEFKPNNKEITQLYDYLKEHLPKGQQLEVWSIWLDDLQKVTPILCKYEELTTNLLYNLYNFKDKHYSSHSCLIIERN